MQFKEPKDDNKYKWTDHVKDKMQYYGISESLIKRIVRHPNRTEEGVAENTVAVMQPTANRKKPTEIWVMYQELKPGVQKKINKIDFAIAKRRIISAWRYPGVSPKGKAIPIPDEILQEIEGLV